MKSVDDGRTDGRRTTEHGYTICSPCEPDGSGELKIGSASMAKIVPKCIKIVSTDVRKYKILSGEIPRAPLTGGVMPPLVLSPFGTHKTSLTFMAGPLFKSRRRPWVGVPNTWNILLNQLTGQVPLIGVPNTCTWNILLNQLTAGQVALVGVPNTWNILLNQL